MPKSKFFQCIFENVDFVKIVVFPKRNCYFSDFDPPKINQKSMPKRTRKKHRKKASQKLILASILASKTLPKWFPKPPKSLQQATQNEACFATLWNSRRNRRKSAGVGVCKLSKGLGIWLGLLYLSIDFPLVALIIFCPSKSFQKASKKEAWTLPRPNGSQAFWDPARPSNHHSND